MTDILRLRHEVSGGYKGCCRCPKQFLPYYDGSDGHWYCEDCGQELVKKKTATFGVLGDPDFNFNFKHPRCLSPTAPPAEGVDNAKWDCGCSYKCSYPSAEMIESARLHLMSHNGTFPHERTDKLLDELEAENKRLREALNTIHKRLMAYEADNRIEARFFGELKIIARKALDNKAE